MSTSTDGGRRYERVSEREFDEFMDSLATYTKKIPEEAEEIVYDIPLPTDDLVVRVWSSISAGLARDKGSDAIRAVIWDVDEDRPIGGREKTLRIGPTDSNPEGWRGNLRPKIQDLVVRWREYDKECSECGSRMAVREPSQGDDWDRFWGCTNYPVCDHAEPIEGEL